MKENELRLGNLLWNPVQEIPVKVDFMLLHKIYLAEKAKIDNGWEPIPITEEWLVRFGFKKRKGLVSDSFYIGMNPVTTDWMFDIVWIKNMMDYSYEGFPFYRNGHFTIKHVHQLQNLYFALTGEELNYET